MFAPSGTGLRMPTDPKKNNGNIINPLRYAELGGLTGPSKIVPSANGIHDVNELRVTKPGGSR
jgi:hypothetical protein